MDCRKSLQIDLLRSKVHDESREGLDSTEILDEHSGQFDLAQPITSHEEAEMEGRYMESVPEF